MSLTGIPSRLPLLPVRNLVVLPGETLRARLLDQASVRLIENKMSRHSLTSTLFGLLPLREDPLNQFSDLEGRVGTVIVISQVTSTNWPQPSYSLLMTGICRFSIDEIIQENPYPLARVHQLDQAIGQDDDLEKMDSTTVTRTEDNEMHKLGEELRSLAGRLVNLVLPTDSPEADQARDQVRHLPVGHVTDLVVALLRPSLDEKRKILEAIDVKERLQLALVIMHRKLDDTARQHRLHAKTLTRSGANTQTKANRRSPPGRAPLMPPSSGQVGEDVEELEKRLTGADLPEEVNTAATKEIRRLGQMSPMMPDYAITKNYLDFLFDLPWNKFTQDQLDLDKAKATLDADHFGLVKPKKRVLEYLAVGQLKKSLRGPIICLVGPPGVGKTSIGRSVARALGRQFYRISLGGVCDQSAIRGHRRTYIGALAGHILQGMRQAGSSNPVFLLDEVDKLSAGGVHGDPASALLEVLDPEQNYRFVDHYLALPFDLSKVLFIATANTPFGIPSPLLDRMELIELQGYTEVEKVHISRNHLLPKQLSEHGLSNKELELPESATSLLIDWYTREAGVRSLERHLAAICRAVAVRVAHDRQHPSTGVGESTSIPALPIRIDSAALEDILGPRQFEHDSFFRVSQPGVAIGLVYTPYGGEVVFVETSALPNGEGKLTQLTGSLGKVIRESAMLALSWIRANTERLSIPASWLSSHNFHVHLPAGAVAKEGPSAGVTLTVAMLSLVWGLPTRSDTGLTGEMTLRGAVLRVGGVKEKVLAANRAGLARVILPAGCRADLEQLPENIRTSMSFVLVSSIEEAIEAVFDSERIKELGLVSQSAFSNTGSGDDKKTPPLLSKL